MLVKSESLDSEMGIAAHYALYFVCMLTSLNSHLTMWYTYCDLGILDVHHSWFEVGILPQDLLQRHCGGTPQHAA